jgi:hypothetical protein
MRFGLLGLIMSDWSDVTYELVAMARELGFRGLGAHLTVPASRITDETAAVTLRAPGDPALRAPNAIGAPDFEGWVQERGIYFAAKWDERYTPLFAFADPGEEPLEGSTIVARYGKGRFVYTGLAFFRQLPAGVPGAYRLLANLVAKD